MLLLQAMGKKRKSFYCKRGKTGIIFISFQICAKAQDTRK